MGRDESSDDEVEEDLGEFHISLAEQHLLTSYILEDFIADQDNTSTGDQPHLRWRELPEEEDGFSVLLNRILECSQNPRNRTPAHPEDSLLAGVGARILFTEDDYPLWWVHCRVGPREDCFK